MSYAEFITKILQHTDYLFGEEESILKIGQAVMSKMSLTILQEKEKEGTLLHLAPTPTLLIEKMAKKNLISP